jgi:hypothetical protein
MLPVFSALIWVDDMARTTAIHMMGGIQVASRFTLS